MPSELLSAPPDNDAPVNPQPSPSSAGESEFMKMLRQASASQNEPQPEPKPEIEKAEDPATTPKEDGQQEPLVSLSSLFGELEEGEPSKDDPEKDEPAESQADPALPDTASPKAKEAFEGIKRQRDEWKRKAEAAEAKANEAAQNDAAQQVESVRSELQTQLDSVIAERDNLQKEIKEIRDKVQTYDIQEDPQFIEEFINPIQRLEAEANALFGASEDADAAIAAAAKAIRLADDSEFYRALGDVARHMPAYSQGQITNVLRDLRAKLIGRQAAISGHAQKAQEYAANRTSRNERLARDFVQTIESVGREIDGEETALNRFKEATEIKRLLEPIRERTGRAKEIAQAVLTQHVAQHGAVSKELTAMVLHGARRVEDAALLRAVAIEHATLKQKYDDLVAKVGSDISSEQLGGGRGSGQQPTADAPKSLAQFMTAQKTA